MVKDVDGGLGFGHGNILEVSSTDLPINLLPAGTRDNDPTVLSAMVNEEPSDLIVHKSLPWLRVDALLYQSLPDEGFFS